MAVVSSLSRRSFLLAGGATFLAACSGSSGDEGQRGAGSVEGGSPFDVARRWDNDNVLTPGVQRLAVSLAQGGALTTEGPEQLDAVVRDGDGKELMALSAKRRGQGIANPYWDFRANLDAPGVYYLVVDGGPAAGAALQVFDPSQVTVPGVGVALPPFDTPTVADHRGVEPYCSRLEGPCPLHDVTLTQALVAGTPVAYMIGTPAHCQTGTCAPALDFLTTAHGRLGDRVTMVHADVYTDDTATTTTPAVQALDLPYEPVLFVTDSSGVVVERLDAIWDQSELDEVLARVAG